MNHLEQGFKEKISFSHVRNSVQVMRVEKDFIEDYALSRKYQLFHHLHTQVEYKVRVVNKGLLQLFTLEEIKEDLK